jgi:hypothetical protein
MNHIYSKKSMGLDILFRPQHTLETEKSMKSLGCGRILLYKTRFIYSNGMSAQAGFRRQTLTLSLTRYSAAIQQR